MDLSRRWMLDYVDVSDISDKEFADAAFWQHLQISENAKTI